MQDAHGRIDVTCIRAASVEELRFPPFLLFQHLCSSDLSRLLIARFLVLQPTNTSREHFETWKPATNLTMSDLNGKRKRVETVDLTADDTDDTDHLDAPMRVSKRQNTSVAHTPKKDPGPTPAGCNNGNAPSFRGSSYPFGGNSFPASSGHTEAERRDWLGEDEDDINEMIGSTQLDAANGTDELHLYGDLDTKIVGVQYYRGFACQGEVILIRREPGNSYDANAIRIDNVNREQIDISHAGLPQSCQDTSMKNHCTAKASSPGQWGPLIAL